MENLRQNIIKTANAEFVKYGIRSVSIDDICEILHISKKTFYTEFRQKEELISIVLENISEVNRREDREMSLQNKDMNAIDMALCYRQPALQKRRKKYEKFMRDLIKYYPDIHNEFVSANKESIKQALLANMKQGVKEGLYRAELEAVDASNVFLDMLYSWLMFFTPDGADIFALKVEGLMRMLCNEKGMDYYNRNKI